MYKLPNKKIWLLRAITAVMVFFGLTAVIFAGFFTIYCRTPVNGNSMLPTLNTELKINGKCDIVYINRYAKISKGDIIVIDATKHPTFGNHIIKRLIAVEGDVVNIKYDNVSRQYQVIVNGEIVDSRPYQDFGYNTYDNFDAYIKSIDASQRNEQGLIIGKGKIFVLGDNWDESKDSALVGPFNIKDVYGKVEIVVKPSQNEFIQVLKRIF